MSTSVPCIRLHLPAEEAWVGLVQTAAQQAGSVFGLDSAKTLRLAHCSEELLLFLSSAKAGEIETTIRPIATGVEVRFSFSASGVNLSAMNLTYVHNAKSEECNLTCLPLLLASRMSDGFNVGLEGRRMKIVLLVNKTYPKPKLIQTERVRVQGQVVFSPAGNTDTLFEACGAIAGLYPTHLAPEWCASPGRTSDLVRGGELFAIKALDAARRLCGIIFWKMRSEQSITFFGPYDFSTDSSVADGLTYALLQAVGRSKAKNVFSSLATLPLSDHGFELLANLPYRLSGSPDQVMHSVWGRMLQEDFGAAVWTHEDFTDFLSSRYDALELMRDLRPVQDFGEAVPDASVLGVNLIPGLSEAFLHPELNGADIADNLARHVASLSSSGYRNIFFEIDLAKSWHAALGGPLKQCGFQPALLLPHGGQSDTLIFHHATEA